VGKRQSGKDSAWEETEERGRIEREVYPVSPWGKDTAWERDRGERIQRGKVQKGKDREGGVSCLTLASCSYPCSTVKVASTSFLVSSIIIRPKAVTDWDISRQGSLPTYPTIRRV
jgi:hypothetical protein